jgi:hypothetical protein
MPELEDVERQVEAHIREFVGPVRPVDDAAVYATVAAAVPDRWRFRAMFSATRIIGATAIVALAGGSLLTGALLPFRGDDTTNDAQGPELVTEEVAPGVERIVRDDADHDLDMLNPTYRLDMDSVTVTPDGTVWIVSSYHDSDNYAKDRAQAGEYPLVWALGRPGALRNADGVPKNPAFFVATADGSVLLVGDRATRLDGTAFVADDGPALRSVRDGTLWLLEPDVLMGMTEGMATRPSRTLASVWTDEGEWRSLVEFGRNAATSQGQFCGTTGVGVECEGPGETVTRYLDGTRINAIAAAPDGSIWAVGDWDGGGGGLYRITPGA